MAKRNGAAPLVKVTINLTAEDYRMIQDYYAASGAASAIRQILGQHCAKMRAKLAQSIAAVAGVLPEIELDGIDLEESLDG